MRKRCKDAMAWQRRERRPKEAQQNNTGGLLEPETRGKSGQSGKRGRQVTAEAAAGTTRRKRGRICRASTRARNKEEEGKEVATSCMRRCPGAPRHPAPKCTPKAEKAVSPHRRRKPGGGSGARRVKGKTLSAASRVHPPRRQSQTKKGNCSGPRGINPKSFEHYLPLRNDSPPTPPKRAACDGASRHCSSRTMTNYSPP